MGRGDKTIREGGAILDAVDAIVLVLDDAGRIRAANRMAELVLGRTAAALVDRFLWDVMPPPEGSEAGPQRFAALLHGRLPHREQCSVTAPDGSERTIRWTLDCSRDEAGQVTAVVATGVETTELQRATRAQHEQLLFLQTLIDTIPNPIFYKGRDGRYLGCNRAFLEMMGRRREEMVGRTVYELSPSALAERYDEADRQLFENPGVQTYEAQVRWADGTLHDVVFYKATWNDSAGDLQGLVGVILDITDRKRAQRQLEEAHAVLEERVRARTAEFLATKEAAEAADRAKSEFLNIASHELRTPLTALRLALQRGQRDLGDRGRVDPQLLLRMTRYVNRLVRLATDLLEASRLERGQLEIAPAPLDLRHLVQLVVDDFQLVAPGRPIDLHLSEGPFPVEGDEDRLAQVLANLIDNAVKYAPPESPIEVRVERLDGEARVTVCDRGPGIPATEQGRLFSRFFRLPSPTHQPGLGLGLNISREIVERHGGSLRYESREGGGSRFVLVLPLAP